MEKTSVLALLLDNKYSNATPMTALPRMKYFKVPLLRFVVYTQGDLRRTDHPAIPVRIERPIPAGQRVHLQRQGQVRDIQAQTRGDNVVAVPFHQFCGNDCGTLPGQYVYRIFEAGKILEQ